LGTTCTAPLSQLRARGTSPALGAPADGQHDARPSDGAGDGSACSAPWHRQGTVAPGCVGATGQDARQCGAKADGRGHHQPVTGPPAAGRHRKCRGCPVLHGRAQRGPRPRGLWGCQVCPHCPHRCSHLPHGFADGDTRGPPPRVSSRNAGSAALHVCTHGRQQAAAPSQGGGKASQAGPIQAGHARYGCAHHRGKPSAGGHPHGGAREIGVLGTSSGWGLNLGGGLHEPKVFQAGKLCEGDPGQGK
jgi:hypothetical protein